MWGLRGPSSRNWGSFYDPVGDMDWNTRDTEIPDEQSKAYFTPANKDFVERVTRESIRNFLAVALTKIDPEYEAFYEETKAASWDAYSACLEGFKNGEISSEDFFVFTKNLKANISLKLWPKLHPHSLEMR